MTKKWLVIGKRNPPEWLSVWSFPGFWPPGWPKPYRYNPNIYFAAEWENAALTLECLDWYGEETNILEGEYIELHAKGKDGKTIRLRRSVDDDREWSEGALIQVRRFGDNSYGFEEQFVFDARGEEDISSVSVEMKLYGIKGGPTYELSAYQE